jgi:hypothetical protein
MTADKTGIVRIAGRTNQKERTRQALLAAARDLLTEGQAPTVARAAQRALVSEATAYRYYSDPRSLLRDALAVNWPGLEALLADLRAAPLLERRAQRAAEAMARVVLANEVHIRALIALSRSESAGETGGAGGLRPAYRFDLIAAVLDPLAKRLDASRRRQLELALAVVISAEAVLTLKDFCACGDEEIVSTLGWSARRMVAAAPDEQGS